MHGIAHYAKKLRPFLASTKMPLSLPTSSRLSASPSDRNKNSGFTYGILMVNELHRAAVIRQSLRG